MTMTKRPQGKVTFHKSSQAGRDPTSLTPPAFRNLGVVTKGFRAMDVGFPSKPLKVMAHPAKGSYDPDNMWSSFSSPGTYPLKPPAEPTPTSTSTSTPIPQYNTSRYVGASLGWLNKDPYGRELMNPNPKHPYVQVTPKPRVTGRNRISYMGFVDPGTGFISVRPTRINRQHR